MDVFTYSCKKHELEWKSREVMMEEQYAREQEIGSVVNQPSYHQDTPTCPPVLVLSCIKYNL